jgi:hypothetical protein
MAETRFVRVQVDGFLSTLDKIDKSSLAALEDLQIEAAKAGADKMKEIIETKGIGRPWSRDMKAKEFPAPGVGNLRSSSSPGRVNTGKMRDAVRYRLEVGKSRIISAFGWIDKPTESDARYFRAQEYGFDAGGFRKDIPVEGMFALRDARLYVTRQVLPRLYGKYKNRIAGGKY